MKSRRDLRLPLMQSVLCALFVLLAFSMTMLFDSALAVASLGASAFIAFAFPRADSSRPRFLVGGYACGALGGTLCGCLRQVSALSAQTADVAYCVLSVFLVVLLMSALGFAHPPSAALALAVTLSDSPFGMAAVAMAGILLLCGMKRLMLLILDRIHPPAAAAPRDAGAREEKSTAP